MAVSGRAWAVSSCRISHLGMKPVRGGRPPKDSSARVVVIVMIGALVQLIARVLIFVVAITLNVRKAADVIMI